MSEWISVEDQLPKNNQLVLIHIVLQRMVGGSFSEDDVYITGGLRDGDWYAGNDLLLWDYDFNLGFTGDDVAHWKPIDPPEDA